MTGEAGSVCDYTYEELQQFFVRKGDLQDKIPTLSEFLARFTDKELTFAIELKVDGIEQSVVDLIHQYGVEGKTMITSFDLARLRKVKECDPYLHVGYLAKSVDEELLQALQADWIDELCPRANLVTPEDVTAWHRLGFNVRAWGVDGEEQMRALCEAGVDGMTVNAPNVLHRILAEREEQA